MKRLLLWSAALLGAGIVGGFVARLVWPQHAHPSSHSSADRFADATRQPFGADVWPSGSSKAGRTG